jgi:TRAP-type C4-dicarboxylate transport system substrate-binding protein
MQMKKTCALIVLMFVICVTVFLYADTADAKTYKFYAIYPEESYITKGLIDAAKAIKERTNGKISIKVFPGQQLGNYEDAVEEVRQGTIDFAITYLGKRYDPRLEMVNLPGCAPLGYKQQEKIWFSEKSMFKAKVDDVLKEIGLVSLGPWPEPYATVFFSKGKLPKNLTDYKNKKCNLRAPGLELYREPYAALGYQLVTMDYSEVFSAMQTGQIDGTIGAVLEIAWLQGKDIVKHIECSRVNSNPGWLLANKEMWESFTPEERKIIDSTIKEFALKTLKQVDEKDKYYAKKLRESGVEVIEHSDKFYVERSAYLRKTVWPKYYSTFGEKFLKDLDAFIAKTK